MVFLKVGELKKLLADCDDDVDIDLLTVDKVGLHDEDGAEIMSFRHKCYSQARSASIRTTYGYKNMIISNMSDE